MRWMAVTLRRPQRHRQHVEVDDNIARLTMLPHIIRFPCARRTGEDRQRRQLMLLGNVGGALPRPLLHRHRRHADPVRQQPHLLASAQVTIFGTHCPSHVQGYLVVPLELVPGGRLRRVPDLAPELLFARRRRRQRPTRHTPTVAFGGKPHRDRNQVPLTALPVRLWYTSRHGYSLPPEAPVSQRSALRT